MSMPDTPTITILRGLPGVGKTRETRKLEAAGATVASPDRFPGLYTPDPDGGPPAFNGALADEAHAASYRTAIETIQAGRDVVVDATNVSTDELVPYVAIGQAYRANVLVLVSSRSADSALMRVQLI